MPEPIYPDKTKTGLAALKPLTDVFFAEPERWEWEIHTGADVDAPTVPYGWQYRIIDEAIKAYTLGYQVRLTPKPRRVWIGDQSYPEPCVVDLIVHNKWIADPIRNMASPADSYTPDLIEAARRNGYLFRNQDAAQQCLDAHRRARRVE